jgi:pyruvate dehydrogenase E2 component (dihydrolipoamide acetyltransferase)
MRTAIGRAMSKSKSSAPHFYVTTDVVMDEVSRLTAETNDGREQEDRVTVTAVLIRTVAGALQQHPNFNSHWTDEGHEIIDDVNVGVAIALEEGLIAPALLNCAERSVDDLSTGLRDLARRSRSGKLRAPEMMGATFTVSNLGMFDVSSFTAIVNPPQVAILAVGKTRQMPVVVDDDVVVRSVMSATVSADHRAVDGAEAAQFLGTLKAALEEPAELFASPSAGS